jgi:hypothetical protein
MKSFWKTYHKLTEDTPPRALLVEALPFVNKSGIALDLGAGSLSESKYLLEKGFAVTAVDMESFESFSHPRFTFKKKKFEKFHYPIKFFDLVNAQFAIPFMSQYDFSKVWPKLKESLVQGGIFTGQFFGTEDGWNNDIFMNFHNKNDVLSLLDGMDVIKLEEVKENKPTAKGEMKHWHIFHIIARKI